jgi:hypothetical protein
MIAIARKISPKSNININHNRWSDRELPLCTQLATCIRDMPVIGSSIQWPVDFDMILPDKLYESMKQSRFLDDFVI